MRGRWWFRVSCLLLLPFLWSTPDRAAPEPEAPGATAPLHLRVVARAFEPYIFPAADQPQGLELDLIDVACSMLGWTYEVRWASLEEALEELKRGRADLAAGGIYMTPEREGAFLLTSPHLRTGLVALTSTRAPLGPLDELAGKRVGVRHLSMGETVAKELSRRMGLGFAVVTFETTDESLAELRGGQLAAVVNDYQNSLFVIRQRYAGQITISRGWMGPRMLSRGDITFAFRPGMESERAAFNHALLKMRHSGLTSHFSDKWLLEAQGVDTRRILELAGILLVLGLLAAGAVLWRSRYRRRFAELEAAEKVTRGLIERSPVGVLLHRSGRVLYMNPEGLAAFGLDSLEAVPGLSTPDLVVPEERDRVRTFAQGRATGQATPDHYKTVGLKRSGERFALEIWAASATLADGPASLIYFKDVEEQDRINKALEKSERDYRELFEKASDAVLVLAAGAGAILDANPQACELYGYSREELLGMTVLDLALDPVRGRLRMADLLARQSLPHFETTHVRKDGQHVQLEVNASLVEYRGRIGILSLHRDITARKLAEAALRRSEERYRDLVENSQDLICTHDLDGKFISVNRAAQAFSGYEQEELVGSNIADFLTPKGRSAFSEYLETVRREGSARGLMSILTKSGEVRVWEYINTLRAEGPGEPYVRGMGRDVTERTLAEKALRENERRLRVLMESANDAIFVADAETGALVDANRRAQELIGRSLEEIRGMSQWGLHPPEERGRYEEIFREHVASGQAIADYLEVVHKDGRRIPVEVSASIVQFGGRLLNLGFFRDVTRRRETEAALIESEERFRTLAQTTSAAIMIYQDDRFEYINPASERMSGYSWEEVRGMKFWELVHPEDRELIQQRGLARQRGEEVPSRYEFRILNKAGETRWMDFSAGLVQWKGRPAGVVTAFDVTERRATEQAVRESEQRLRLILEGIQEIIYAVRFDQGPLTSTCTFASDQVGPILGLTPEDFYADPALFQKILHPQDESSSAEAISEMLATGEPASRTYRLFSKTTGGYRWFEDRMAPLRDESGAITGFQGTARDVTEQRVAAERMRQHAKEQEALLRSSQAMAGFLDLKPAARAICEAAVEAFDLKMAWIGLVVPEGTEVRVLASAGFDEGYTNQVRVRWDLSPRAMGPTGRAIKERRPVTMRVEHPQFAPWKEAALKRGYRSLCGIPLLHEDAVRGALNMYSADPEFFTASQIGVMELFARQATMSIVNAALYEEAKQTIEELGALNEELTSAQEQQRLQLKAIEESQRNLESSEARFRQLAETADAAIFISREFRYLYVNPHMEMATGYSRQELMEMESWQIVHPEDKDKVLDPAFAQRDMDQGPIRYELRIIRKDGETRWVDISAGFLMFEGQRAVIGTAYDVTERKLAEAALIQSEESFRRTFDLSPVGSVMVGMDNRFLRCNQSYCRFLGYEEEELVGKTFLDLTHPEDLHVGMTDIGRLARGEQEVAHFQKRYLRKDGSVAWGELTVRVVPGPAGAPDHFLTIVQDVTERKRAEEALRESRVRFQQIVEHSINLFYTHTPDHVLTYVSPQSGHFLGCDPKEAQIRWQEFLTDNPENEKGVKLTQRAIDTGERQPPYELELKTKDGRVVWVQVNETPMVEDGRTVSIVGALTDITARRKAEQVLLDSERRYRAIVEKAGTVVLKFDRELRVTYWNEFATVVFGYTKKEILGRSLIGTIVPETESTGRDLRALLSAIVEDPNRFASNINQNITKNGRRVWMAWTNRPILDSRGELEEVLSMATDITALKESELAQRGVVEGLRKLRALSPVPLVAVDRDAKVLEWNEAAERLTGWSHEDVRGAPCPLLASTGLPGFREFLEKAEREGEASQVVRRCRLKDGSRLDLKATAVPLRDAYGKTVSLQVILIPASDS